MAIHKIKFFTGRASRYLAEKIVESYGTTLGKCDVLQFSDGEFQPRFDESIRGCMRVHIHINILSKKKQPLQRIIL